MKINVLVNIDLNEIYKKVELKIPRREATKEVQSILKIAMELKLSEEGWYSLNLSTWEDYAVGFLIEEDYAVLKNEEEE